MQLSASVPLPSRPEFGREPKWGSRSNAVNTLSRYFHGHSIAGGGQDFEPGFGQVGPARAWAAAFSANSPRRLYNFGSADGCPPKPAPSGRRGGSCNNGWTQSDIYYLSGQQNRYPFPEIYYSGNVPQWPAISLFAVQTGHQKLHFPGPVTQYQRAKSSFAPSTAWSKLFKALRRNPKTSQGFMNYSTDFQHDGRWGH
jgi:hypothetical protein